MFSYPLIYSECSTLILCLVHQGGSPKNWLHSEAPTMACNYAKNEHVLVQKNHIKSKKNAFSHLLLLLDACCCCYCEVNWSRGSKNMLCAEISMMVWNGATKINHVTEEKFRKKGRTNKLIYLPLLVDASCCCLQWVGWGCGSKTCCIQRNLRWHGRVAARIEHGNEQEYGKKTGFPLNTTINHRSGDGVENKTYRKWKIRAKEHRMTQKLKRKWKLVHHHGGRIKAVHNG